MPFVNIKVAGEMTRQQKESVVKRVTDVLFEELGKDPASTYIVIDEVPRENWAKKGELLS